MARLHCPRCRGSLFFTAEDNLPRFSCIACGRSFVPERKPSVADRAA
jgi:transposase-like protein